MRKMKNYQKIEIGRGTIAGRNIRSLILLAVFLVFGVCLIAGRLLYTRNIRIYTDFVYSYAHLIADNISGIVPTKFLETQTKDEDYYNIRYTLMTAGIYEEEFRDFYLVIPTEDDLIYISEIHQNLPEGREALSDSQAEFLEHRAYHPGEKEIMMKILSAEYGTQEQKLYMGLREFYGEKMATALVPLYTLENEVSALVGIDISVAAIWDTLMNLFVMLAITIMLIISVGIAIHYHVLKRTLIQPITTLKTAADELVNKLDREETFVSDIHTGDEIEALAHSIEEMDHSLKQKTRELMTVTAEQERINTELELASSIQMDMLPRVFPPFPDRKEIDIYASMNPAKEVGGDFYDFFFIDENRLALVIADVSGKGIPAALFMMMVKIMVENCVLAGLGPKQAMEQVNQLTMQNNRESMFVTVWLGILDITSGTLTAVNAGHEYPILKRPGGYYELLKDKHGLAVGAMEGIRYKEYELNLEKGSSIFVYSDGLPEANNSEGKMFGLDRTLAALNEDRDAGAEETLKAVRCSVDAFVGQTPRFDDMTMMCLVYHGPGHDTEEIGTALKGEESHG